MRQPTSFPERFLIALTWAYFTFLFGWLAAYAITGDRFGYLALTNSLAVYFFTPLPAATLVAALTRRRDLLGGVILGAGAFLWLWGPLFMPRLDPPAKSGNPHPPLTVMTYNVLGPHDFSDPIIEVIRAVDADVVCLQEVNPRLAEALRVELAEAYPYQILEPAEGVSGLGTISRYALSPVDEKLPLKWVGVPQVLALDFEGTAVTLVNFHAISLRFFPLSEVNRNFEYRQAQAQVLADFAERTPGPLIFAGDANTTPLSTAYQILTQGPLRDAFREAGFGFGHTFPGSDLPASLRPHIEGWYVPQWMARIDYVFVSPHWTVLSAAVAPFDGVSDHRGVVAVLSIDDKGE